MKTSYADQAVELLEKANANLDPELMSIPDTKNQLETYARARRLIDFGIAALAGKLDDAERLAKVTGTSIGKAKETVATGKVLDDSRDLSLAMQGGTISLDQATEIARAEAAAPGAAKELLKIAKVESFHVLKDEARRTKLEAEQHRGLAERQRKARRAVSHTDEMGMVEPICHGSPTSEHRSRQRPKPKRSDWRGPRRRAAARWSPSSDTWPTLTPACCRDPARAEPSARSWSFW